MDAELELREFWELGPTETVELVIWRVPEPVRGSTHHFKYRLAFIVEGECVLRYDNEAGKGDHRHVREHQGPYTFVDLVALQADFWTDVSEWRRSE
jgi:hypothetical protein